MILSLKSFSKSCGDLFITNNRALFHLWRKESESLVKHQKVSKYYENDCRIRNCDLFCLLKNLANLNNKHHECKSHFLPDSMT